MYRILKKANFELKDVTDFIEKISAAVEFFNPDKKIFITRCPGRLDVMGGIADYCGSLVLEMPIAEATLTALQKNEQPILKILSSDNLEILTFEMPLSDFFDNNNPIDYETAQNYFKQDPANHWAAYIAGVFLVLMREKKTKFEQGANIFISTEIPQGKGVSSSAALESSVMSAVTAAFELNIEPREMALLCQKVENLVVGAPCGIMDQMAVICGKENELMAMVCQPAELKNSVKIPAEIALWGIDSGIRHSVSGADYSSVRTGAFIGYRIIAELAGLPVSKKGKIEIHDEKWGGYLSNISPTEFENNYQNLLPKEICGTEFLQTYDGITDLITRVEQKKKYAVFYPTAHPVYENSRVHKFAELLGQKVTEEVLVELGKLMFAAHESYSLCGLGSDGTDLLVELVKKIGIGNGLYGAKITGGGSGGTVAVLGRQDASGIIEKVVAEYQKQTGYQPYIFKGSSPGTTEFGYLSLQLV